MPLLSLDEQKIRHQIATDFITQNELPRKKIQTFLFKHFTHTAENGLKYQPTHLVRNKIKDGKTFKEGSKSNLTLKNYEDICVKGSTEINGKDWKPFITPEQAEYFEVRPNLATEKPMCIVDFDGWKSSGDINLKELFEIEEFPELFEDCPFFLSRTKSLPHFIFYITNVPDYVKTGNYIKVIKGFEGDILFNHAWEKMDSQLYNYNGELPLISWNDLKPLISNETIDGKKLLNEPKPRKKKELIIEDNETDTDAETVSSVVSNIEPKLNEIKGLVSAILEVDKTFFDEYPNWSQLGYIIYNETNGNDVGAELFHSLSNCDKTQTNQQYYKTQPKRTKDNKLFIATLYKWLKDKNPNHPLLKKVSRKQGIFADEDEVRISEQYIKYRTEFEAKNFKLNNPVRYIEKGDNEIIIRDKKDFLERYRDEKGMPTFPISGAIGIIPKHFTEIYLDDTEKKKCSKIIFNPNPDYKQDETEIPVYNAFTGFPNKDLSVEALTEENSDFLKLMKYLFPENKVYEYMKSWFANIIQRPHIKTKVAPVLFSFTHGTGKNSLVDGFISILGSSLTGVIESIEDITKNFNAHLCNKLFIYGDEISANAKKVADRIKQVITRPEQNWEKKNQDAIKVSDFTNWIFTTNNNNCFRIEEGDRRLLLIKCCEIAQNNLSVASYAEIGDPLKLKQLFKFFYEYKQSEESITKYGKFNVGQDAVISTEYKKELTFEGRPAYIKAFYTHPEDFINKKMDGTKLFETIQTYAKANHLSSNFTRQEFSKQTTKFIGDFKKRGNTGQKYQFPETKTELNQHLFKVDEDYYRYINQLDDDFIPEFNPATTTIKTNWRGEKYEDMIEEE
jgi:hypothetical protein